MNGAWLINYQKLESQLSNPVDFLRTTCGLYQDIPSLFYVPTGLRVNHPKPSAVLGVRTPKKLIKRK
jgi:hypothetical protein